MKYSEHIVLTFLFALMVCACTAQGGGNSGHPTIDDIINNGNGGDNNDSAGSFVLDEKTIEAAQLTDLMRSKAQEYRVASMLEGHRNGVYVYSVSYNAYESNPEVLAARIAVLGFQDVYLSTGGTSKIKSASADLRQFISACTAYGIKVYAIRLSEAKMLSDESIVQDDVTLIASYNAKVSKSERFAGISADIEPHIVRSSNPSGVVDDSGAPVYWSSADGYGIGGPNDTLLGLTLERLTSASTLLHAKSLSLNEAVLPNYQREFNNGVLSHGSTSQFLECCDFLVTMAYKTTKEKIWDYASYVLDGTDKPSSVSVCIKTKVNDQDSSTINPRSWSHLIEVASYISRKGNDTPSYRGLDVFTYEGIEQMWEWTNDTN